MRSWHKLTAAQVRGIKTPGKYGDGGGLMLDASATERKGVVNKSYQFRFQIDGREQYMGLGSARVVSLGEARAKADEARKLLAAGINPKDQRDTNRAAARAAALRTATFKHCFDGLLAGHGDGWREKHLKQWQNSMATYCKPLLSVNVGDVDTPMVLSCIEPQWKAIPVTMDRVRGRIGEVLGWAQVRGLRAPGPLPTLWKGHLDQLLPHPREVKPVVHHPALAYDAVPALFAKLIASDGIPELCLAFTILTSVRSQEARGARRDRSTRRPRSGSCRRRA